MNENNKRLDVLYRKHHEWLKAVAFNICNDEEMTEDLVQDLYLYLADKQNENLYYKDSFNLMYCLSFLKSRFINKVKINNKTTSLDENWDETSEEYDTDMDITIDKTYEDVKHLIKQLQSTKMWPSAMISDIYYFSDKTLDTVASEIGISKSTAFLAVRRVKEQIKLNIKNPFKDNDT
jgi:DNA-directed RNA polymerase specialized sigma24 family protein